MSCQPCDIVKFRVHVLALSTLAIGTEHRLAVKVRTKALPNGRSFPGRCRYIKHKLSK